MTAAAPLRRRPRAGPYNVPRPAVISFSGGRTSGYMLKHILDAHGGRLSEDLSVVFANTGMERPETLDFIDTCARAWSIDLIWADLDWSAPHRPERPSLREREAVPARRDLRRAESSRAVPERPVRRNPRRIGRRRRSRISRLRLYGLTFQPSARPAAPRGGGPAQRFEGRAPGRVAAAFTFIHLRPPPGGFPVSGE